MPLAIGSQRRLICLIHRDISHTERLCDRRVLHLVCRLVVRIKIHQSSLKIVGCMIFFAFCLLARALRDMRCAISLLLQHHVVFTIVLQLWRLLTYWRPSTATLDFRFDRLVGF